MTYQSPESHTGTGAQREQEWMSIGHWGDFDKARRRGLEARLTLRSNALASTILKIFLIAGDRDGDTGQTRVWGEGTELKRDDAHWTLMECSVEQKINGACIAFEKRLAWVRESTSFSNCSAMAGREKQGWGRTCFVISSCSSRANVANASYFVPIWDPATASVSDGLCEIDLKAADHSRAQEWRSVEARRAREEARGQLTVRSSYL